MRRVQREEPQIVFTQAPVDYITGGTPVERTDTIVYNGADYPLGARPDPRYTIGATPTNNTEYITREQYEVGRAYELYQGWLERNAEREARTIREMEEYIAQEREHERAIEEALEQFDAQREQERMIETLVQERYRDGVDYEDFAERPDPSGVTLLRESDYFRMEREGRLEPDIIYYTYPNDSLADVRTERHPKIVKIAYFID